MKIALVISTMGAGGAERIVSVVSRAWAEAGREVCVITLDNRGKGSFYPLHPEVRLLDAGAAAPVAGPAGKVLNNFARISALRRRLKEEKPAVVIAFMDQTNVTAQLAAAGLGVPVIVTEHIDPLRWSPGKPWELLRRLLYPRAAALVCVSRGVLEGFPPALRRNAHVIYNPVSGPPPGAAPARGRGPRRTLLSVGRLTAQKGFDLLLEAFSSVAAAHPDWDLEIWGEGPDRAALERRAAAPDLAGRVRLPGLTSDVYGKMLAADVFVLSSRFEGFGIVICEAMDCGLPVVSFDCPKGPSEIITDGQDGLLAPAGDVAALAARIAGLMEDPARRAALGGAAARAALAYRPEAVLAEWEKLFSRLGIVKG